MLGLLMSRYDLEWVSTSNRILISLASTLIGMLSFGEVAASETEYDVDPRCNAHDIAPVCSHLGEARVDTLLEVLATKDYSLQVLTGEVAGQERTVVLLGETHFKNEASAMAGKAMLAQFPYRGVEYMHTNTLVAGVLQLPNILLLECLFSLTGRYLRREQGSTIHDALQDGLNIPADAQAGNLTTNVLLESGSYDLLTLSQSYLFSATMVNLLLSPVAPGIDGYLLYSGRRLTALTLITAQIWLSMQANGFAADIDQLDQYNPALYPLQWFFVSYRNQLMANNIIKNLAINPDRLEMLVIVGERHVPGIEALLRNHHQFTPLLESPTRTEALTFDTSCQP